MKIIRLVLGYLRHNLMAAMAYRSAFFLQAFGMLLNDVMLLFFWWAFFQRFPGLQGWDLAGVVTLYGVVAFGYGMHAIVCGNAAHLPRIIATGGLDYYLALPADPLIHLLISRMSLNAWGDVLFGLLVFLIAVPGGWLRLPLFLLLGLIAALIFASFRVIVGAAAFWMGSAEYLAGQMNMALITFGLYPVDIFPSLVRVLLYTLIPGAFVGTIPARLLTDFSWGQLALLAAFATGITLIAYIVFHLGLRRYESGNLVTMRG